MIKTIFSRMFKEFSVIFSKLAAQVMHWLQRFLPLESLRSLQCISGQSTWEERCHLMTDQGSSARWSKTYKRRKNSLNMMKTDIKAHAHCSIKPYQWGAGIFKLGTKLHYDCRQLCRKSKAEMSFIQTHTCLPLLWGEEHYPEVLWIVLFTYQKCSG